MRVNKRLLRQPIADFELHSVMLFSTVLVGMLLAASVQAQTSPPPAAPAPSAQSAKPTPGTPGTDTMVGDAQSKMRLSSAQVQQAFQHIDRNRDGNLSRAEVGVFPRVERHFERIDSNGDGTLSPTEFEEALQRAS